MRRASDLLFTLFISGLVAFCSMGYELLIARFLSSISSDAVMSQSVTVGTFLLSLGFGAYLYGRKTRGDVWRLLTDIEIYVGLIASVALVLMALASLYIRQPLTLIFAAQLVTILIGTLSGFELPALIDAARPYSKRAFGWVLATNYVGSLFASIALPIYFVPTFGIYVSGWILALFTALAASLAFMRRFNFYPHVRWLGLAAVLVLPPWLTTHKEPLEQFYLKSYYFIAPTDLTVASIKDSLSAQSTIPDVLRISSPYQEIDIISDDLELFGGPRTSGFHLFIDQRNQFGSDTEQIYHDTMVHASINLSRTIPRKVLIIGGGDGLIVRELLKYPEVEAITLIELDPTMIDLANNFAPLREINRGALKDPRVTVETADGFAWLRKSKDSFDAVMIDLPHPYSVDLSRLYSVEFYKFVRSRLSDKGFIVFDFPFDGLMKTVHKNPANIETVESILSAIEAAGFRSRKGFGSWESFLIATPEQKQLEFDYDALDAKVGTLSAFNMATLKLPETKDVRPNSIFKPVILRTRLDGS